MSQQHSSTSTGGLQIAPFKFEVTPPLGHSCCGGWIKPVEVIDDALEANGIVFLGAGRPIVLCAVDWTGLSNATHPMTQQMQPDDFVCTAAYGDGGPWYIPVKEEWDSGGYEVSSALCEPVMDDLLTAAMKELLTSH